MKKDNLLNKIDTTFYFIIDSEDKNLKVTDHAADKICEKFNRTSATISEQVNVIYVSKIRTSLIS